jgi:hypothetical protein
MEKALLSGAVAHDTQLLIQLPDFNKKSQRKSLGLPQHRQARLFVLTGPEDRAVCPIDELDRALYAGTILPGSPCRQFGQPNHWMGALAVMIIHHAPHNSTCRNSYRVGR